MSFFNILKFLGSEYKKLHTHRYILKSKHFLEVILIQLTKFVKLSLIFNNASKNTALKKVNFLLHHFSGKYDFFRIRRYHKLKSIIMARKLEGDPEENSVKKPSISKTEKQLVCRAKTTVYFLRLYNLAHRLSKRSNSENVNT